jgi:hypothetical protein
MSGESTPNGSSLRSCRTVCSPASGNQHSSLQALLIYYQ